MLARLQQAIAIGWASGWALWLLLTLPGGHLGLALAGSLLAVGGHAAVLGLEFRFMARLNRADAGSGVPPASRWQLLRAWWGESVSAPHVFLWLQPFRSRRWPDHLPAGAKGRRGVLLVHGFVCNRGLWNRWLQRLTQRGVPFVAVDLEPVFGSIDDYVPLLEQAVQRLESATGLAPVVVAHSMGGLATRRWRAEAPGHAARLHHVITLGTPHHGTWLARLAFMPNARQMRLHGPWLQALAEREARHGAADHRGFTCFHGHCDNIVFPARTATLPGADNRHIAGTAHVHMVRCGEPWDELLRRLD